MKTLYVIVPCYNEEEVLGETKACLKKKIKRLIREQKIEGNSRILFVDDGSADHTLPLLRQANQEDAVFSYISFSRNFGHQSALLAGLLFAVEQGAQITISIDADLQQDIDAIDDFLLKHENGAEIVYGVRNSRNTDSFWKRHTATAFYDLMNFFGCNIIKNHADYRLMSAKAVRALQKYKEVNLFLRGMVPLCGFQTDIVYFDVGKRRAGESKYTVRKMLNFALDGITSLSMKPIRWIALIGAGIFLAGMILILFFLTAKLMGKTVDGWTSMIVSVWALGGMQLMAIGAVGEYVGKTYMETKGRPRYIIKEFRDGNSKEYTD